MSQLFFEQETEIGECEEGISLDIVSYVGNRINSTIKRGFIPKGIGKCIEEIHTGNDFLIYSIAIILP